MCKRVKIISEKPCFRLTYNDVVYIYCYIGLKCSPVALCSHTKMADLHSLHAGTRPINAFQNNGPDHLVLERFKLRELAKGWSMYRYVVSCVVPHLFVPTSSFSDAREWEIFRYIFHPNAFVYTTWTGEDFITHLKPGWTTLYTGSTGLQSTSRKVGKEQWSR
jgi:hypothetical protein